MIFRVKAMTRERISLLDPLRERNLQNSFTASKNFLEFFHGPLRPRISFTAAWFFFYQKRKTNDFFGLQKNRDKIESKNKPSSFF